MYTTYLNHFNNFFFGLAIIIITYKLSVIVVYDTFLLISEETFFQFICTVPFRKLRKSTDAWLVKHRAATWKFSAFPATIQAFFFTTVIILTPAVDFTASVLTTDTIFIL